MSAALSGQSVGCVAREKKRTTQHVNSLSASTPAPVYRQERFDASISSSACRAICRTRTAARTAASAIIQIRSKKTEQKKDASTDGRTQSGRSRAGRARRRRKGCRQARRWQPRWHAQPGASERPASRRRTRQTGRRWRTWWLCSSGATSSRAVGAASFPALKPAQQLHFTGADRNLLRSARAVIPR